MHVYYKFGLFLIFILSVSTFYTRAAPATNQSSSLHDDYTDDYDDYYDETEGNAQVSTEANRLMPTVDVNATATAAEAATATAATAAGTSTAASTATTTVTALKPNTYATTPLINEIDLPPKRSNHVLEPSCPKACLCLEDYKYIQCSNARLTEVPSDLPDTALIVDLSRNHIRELQPHNFANCSKVREINLNENELTEIPKETFEGLHRLQRLHLANNHLTQIAPDAFAGATDLSTLDLSNNSIVLTNGSPFLNQPGLLELSCRNCNWSQLYDDTFTNLSSLTALKLDLNDFNKKINTQAFTPLRNLIKLKLPELDQTSVQELCNLLKSIDNISFKHFDVSCFELVLGASFNESLILATDPPYKKPPGAAGLDRKIANDNTTTPKHAKPKMNNSDADVDAADNNPTANLTLPDGSDGNDTSGAILKAGILGTVSSSTEGVLNGGDDAGEKPYQVPVSQEAINIMLISIMVVAVIGLIIGIICRKDVGGIKTKCCRTRKPEPKDQVHPTEEIPLNKLA